MHAPNTCHLNRAHHCLSILNARLTTPPPTAPEARTPQVWSATWDAVDYPLPPGHMAHKASNLYKPFNLSTM